LIDDLLSLARIQEGRLTLAPWPLDVAEAIDEAVTLQRPNAENAGLALVATVPDGLIVEADPTRVRQILVNLITNAIKFSNPGDRIDVGAESSAAGDVVIFVRDQGPGVAARDIERIFQPYEQVSGLARGRGAGLGLPLSRQLARLMGGDLWVEQVQPNGSEFRFRLRQKMPPPRVPLEAKMFDASDNGRRPK
ncbi:MAG TPA: HAMP domain-containing sensor histidine kinase, partial [Longimicrobiales bacterium]|nr:HAMP domain-containing sensor histidine kinase [Longimicrobiales bacterium]